MKVDLSFDKSILKAVAVDTSGKVVDHYAVELSVSRSDRWNTKCRKFDD